jgi:hypothetical protein
MDPVQIYVDGARMGVVYFDDFGKLTLTVSKASTATIPVAPRGECAHEHIAEGFAYRDWSNEHWPVRVCRDCRTVLAGRDPYPAARDRPAWEFTELDVVTAKWVEQWPKWGRPRAKKPPRSTEWPPEPG